MGVGWRRMLTGLRTQHNVDPSVYTRFHSARNRSIWAAGTLWILLLVRGHTNGGTAYLLKKEGLIFTGDAWDSGATAGGFRTSRHSRTCGRHSETGGLHNG